MLRTVADIGERGVIDLVRSRMPAQWLADPRVVVGIGHDAAVLKNSGHTVVCTDAVVEGVHFRSQWSSGVDIGTKLAARNFIDLRVMGAQPDALVVSLTAPMDTAVSWLEDFVDGLVAECLRAGAVLVGGDTTSGWGLVASATAVGSVNPERLVTRAGARASDVVAVSDVPGRAAAGLAALMAGRADDIAASLVTAHVRPQPNYAAAHRATLAGATSMIDTSDGLLTDCAHIATASSVCIDLNPESLPTDSQMLAAAETLAADARSWQMTGGEDHCVIATFPSDAELPDGFAAIGTVSAGSGQVLVQGRPWVGHAGFEHFR